MRRSNTMERKRFMGRSPIGSESPELSDEESLARHMLLKGYRTAKKSATDNYHAAVNRSDKVAANNWHNVVIWISLLSG
jgi:hypothetical protein